MKTKLIEFSVAVCGRTGAGTVQGCLLTLRTLKTLSPDSAKNIDLINPKKLANSGVICCPQFFGGTFFLYVEWIGHLRLQPLDLQQYLLYSIINVQPSSLLFNLIIVACKIVLWGVFPFSTDIWIAARVLCGGERIVLIWHMIKFFSKLHKPLLQRVADRSS